MRRATSLLAIALVAAACTGSGGPRSDRSPRAGGNDRPDVEVSAWARRQVCSLPRSWVARIWRGYSPGRSGEIQIVPQTFNYFGARSHSGPWPHLQRVPMFLFGPGHIRASGPVERPTTLADLAPTLAALAGFEFEAPDGELLEEALLGRGDPPRLVLTVVWDGGGRNVLDEWPDAWPNVRRLIDRGTWYEDFTVGSSPSVTPAIHTNLGTGAFPRNHGLVDLRLKIDGNLKGARGNLANLIVEPAMTDLYDRARDNAPVIGMVGSAGTVGMIGHGSAFTGGDRDVAAAQTQDEWFLTGASEELYAFPAYINDVPGLEGLVQRLDAADGELDDLWRGEPFPEDLSETPAFGPYETEVIRQVVRREGFGADDVTDFLFVNYKQIDKVGHRFSMNAPHMEDVIRSSDTAFQDLIRLLNHEAGEGEWVITLTADHGSSPDVSVTGGFVIDIQDLYGDLLARFDRDGDDRPSIQSARVTQVWVDPGELEENGFTIEDVARYLSTYTEGDNAGSSSERIFQSVFPSASLEADLPCVPKS